MIPGASTFHVLEAGLFSLLSSSQAKQALSRRGAGLKANCT